MSKKKLDPIGPMYPPRRHIKNWKPEEIVNRCTQIIRALSGIKVVISYDIYQRFNGNLYRFHFARIAGQSVYVYLTAADWQGRDAVGRVEFVAKQCGLPSKLRKE
jgi:hypothetical protein